MISDPPRHAFVWIWLPGQTEPVVAGRIDRQADRFTVTYGRRYLDRPDAIPLFLPELPLQRGPIFPAPGLEMAGCLRDAAPDAWGRRVILNHRFGARGEALDTGLLDDLSSLLLSGSDRAGALDFQASAEVYMPRLGGPADLSDLLEAVDRVEAGVPLAPDLDAALFHGTSIGGARPKALVQEGDRRYIAKFSSSGDVHNVVKGEFVAMRLARDLGLDVAPVRLTRAAGRDVLLVERFDRVRLGQGWGRRAMVSALTLFGLSEMQARYASYGDLAEIIRHRFTAPQQTLRELFRRLVFNVLVGNTDDHARNHAAFWDGRHLTLTSAYDLCPQVRTGHEAGQAMLIVGDRRDSTLAACLAAAPQFCLSPDQAIEETRRLLEGLRAQWQTVCAEAGLTGIERSALEGRAVLNPFLFRDAPPGLEGA